MIAQKHFDGQLMIPGHPRPEAECPGDLLEQPPPPPKLNVCIQRGDLYPEIPESVVKARLLHTAKFIAGFEFGFQ